MKSIWINAMLALLTTLTMYSCYDNSVVTSPPPAEPLITDSSFFDWKIKTAYGSLSLPYQFYVADTNKVFVAGNTYGIFFDNETVKQIRYHDLYPQFEANCVNGTSPNNVYFAGSAGGLTRRSHMVHWSGSSITGIEFPDDSSIVIGNIEIVSENDIWMSTRRNIIYRYYNSQVYSYKIDSGFTNGRVFLDGNGELMASYYRPIYGCPSDCSFICNLYRFENGNWNVITSDTSDYSSSELQPEIGKINSGIIRTGKTGVYYRSGNSWQKFINTGGLINLRSIAGENRSNVLMYGPEDGVGNSTFYFDGSKIYRQPDNSYPQPVIYSMQYKFGRYYMTTHDYFDFVTYLYVATFKKLNSENLIQKKNEYKIINRSNNAHSE